MTPATTEFAVRLLEANPGPQVLIGEDERVVVLNAAACHLFGDGMIGRHYVTAFRQPALVDCVETALRQRRAGQARYLSRQVRRDATWRATVRPIDLPEGRGALVTFEDTSAVDAADQMRRDFVANVSHELRTPLTAMLGFIETLRGAARHDPKAQERFLAIMEEEAQRMKRLVRDLLSLSRVESEERMRPRTSVEVGTVLATVVSSLRQIAEERNVRIVQRGPDDRIEVQGDPDQLFQVFANLLENAIKYGGTDNEIVVATETRDRDPELRAAGVRISIVDRGPGIERVHIPRLTERFYRVDTHRSRELGGTGLGLAIVKHIVNRHRGRLKIDSTSGEGSTFSVILPVGKPVTARGSEG